MRKYYSIKQKTTSCDCWVEADALDSLARTVYENSELIDIGVLDHNGDPIMAVEKKNPVGFVHHKSRKETF